MIAYEELAAALERWRIRNGLPGTPPLFADGPMRIAGGAAPRDATAADADADAYGEPAGYDAPEPAYAAPAYAAPPPPPPPPPPAPPAHAAAATLGETLDDEVGEFGEDDVLDEAALDNEGPDYAMPFSTSPSAVAAQAAGMSAEDERESTLIGATDPGIVPPPLEAPAPPPWPEAESYESSDATSAGAGWGQDHGHAEAAPLEDPLDDEPFDDDKT